MIEYQSWKGVVRFLRITLFYFNKEYVEKWLNIILILIIFNKSTK